MTSKLARFLEKFYDVPWCVPAWGWAEAVATARSFSTGSVERGPAVVQFSAAVRDYLGQAYALPVNRGRTAIEVGLRAMGIRPGDDVVLPSFICRSVLEAVLAVGATPVFADIDETLNVTAATVAAALTPRTRCVIAAHLFGTAARVDEIAALLAPRGIRLMDDAAQALGVRLQGRLVGTFGDCGIVCCGPGKPLAGAAGGLLVTNDKQLYERAAAVHLEQEQGRAVAERIAGFWIWRRLRRYTLPFSVALERVRGPRVEAAHVNAGMSNLDGAIALAQFRGLERHAATRRRHAQLLAERLSLLPATIVTDRSATGMAVKLIYLLPEGGPTADQVIETLARHGIEAQSGYAPLHTEYDHAASLAVTAAVARRVLSVPLETRPSRAERIPFAATASALPELPVSSRSRRERSAR